MVSNLIETFTGLKVDPLNLNEEDVRLTDIAHSLSRQCRYNGHSRGHLSVARHSIWVSEYLEHIGVLVQDQLWGLPHDAAESYLGDLVRPIKHSPFGAEYLKAEARAEKVIAEHFHLPFPIPPVVRGADNATLSHEVEGLRYSWDSSAEQDELDFVELSEKLIWKRAHIV